MATNTAPAKISCVKVFADEDFIGYANRIAKRGFMQVIYVSPTKKTFSKRDAKAMKSSALLATSFVTATGKTYYPAKSKMRTELVEAWAPEEV